MMHIGKIGALCGVALVLPDVGATLADGVCVDTTCPLTMRVFWRGVGRTSADAGIALGAVAGWQLACSLVGLSFFEHNALILAVVVALSSRRRGQTWTAWARPLCLASLIGVLRHCLPFTISVDFFS